MSSYDLRRGWGFRGAIIAGAVAVAGLAATAARPAAQASIPSTPDTPFKLATFEAQGKTRLGIVLGTRVLDIDAASKDLVGRAKVPAVAIPADMRTLIEQYGTVSPRLYQIANYFKTNPTTGLAYAYDVDKVSFKAPIKYPWNVLAAAANYRAHAEGMAAVTGAAAQPPPAPPAAGATPPAGAPAQAGGFNAAVLSQIDPDRDAPIMFAKSPRSCIIDPNEPYYIPPGRERTDWEGELAIIIGKPARLVAKESTKDYVFGYSIMYDVSDRGGGTPRRQVSMFPGANWFEGKSVDRGAPFGPVIVPKEFLPNAENLKLTTKVNGEIMQDGNTNQLIWKERHLVKYLSDILTLYPGDVIATGTPAGTGAERRKFLKAGDTVEIEIEGIGKLVTPIKAHSEAPATRQ